MLGDSAVLGTAVGGAGGGAPTSAAGEDAPAAAAAAASPAAVAGGGGADGAEVAAGGGGSNSGDDYERGERSFGGNRWPRQETLALLKIRSDMDVAFRDASVKGPLWEEVSRKLAELGYHRNAKKCKEKFENVYKYHKRTKEGRSGKSEGKTYRFFDQLEALENNPAAIHSPRPPSQVAALSATPVSMVKTTASLSLPLPPPPLPQHVSTNTTTTPVAIPTVPSTMPQASILNIPTISPTYFPTPLPLQPPPPPTSNNPAGNIPPSNFPNIPTGFMSNSTSSSSSTSSDETIEGKRKRKRKWKDFFERLMKEVIEKQEELQRRFLEAIEKREQERAAREEAWRVQELQRINKEREILAQERSIAAAKDQAVMSFLQKIAEQQNNTNIPLTPTIPTPTPTVQQQQQQQEPQVVPANVVAATTTTITTTAAQPAVVVPVVAPPQQPQVVTGMEIVKADNNNNNGENMAAGVSSSRWPKAEVQALIDLRTSLDAKYNESGPKGPLWEEISSLMKKNGYNRNAKRCKEKWENINKYFKKVKESNKKRPEDSKTCPYFHQLDALYREKNKNEGGGATVAPLMVRPEQQWPPQQAVIQPPDVVMEDARQQQPEQQHHDGDDDEDDEDEEVKDMDEDEDDDDDDDDEGGGNNFEIVASKPIASSSAAE